MNALRPFRIPAAAAALAMLGLSLLPVPCAPPPPAAIENTGPGPREPVETPRTRPAVALGGRFDRSPEPASGDGAIRRLDADARHSPETAGRWVRLGDALMQRSRETQDASLYLRARSAYERASELDDRDVEALVGLAWVGNTIHDFTQGRSWAEKALAIDAKNPRARSLLGDAAVELGDYEMAAVHYQAALDVQPDLSTLSRAGHLAWIRGDGRKARWLMERAIKAGGPHAENTAWCRAQLALLLWHAGALLPAQQQAATAVQEAPHNPLVLAAAGRIEASALRYPEAIDLYRRSVAAAPNHDALVALVDLYRVTGQSAEAEAQMKRVIEFHQAGTHQHPTATGAPGEVHAHPPGTANAQLAQFFADHDQHLEEALRQAELAYSTFKNVATADTLAWCYFKQGRYAEARALMQQALRWHTPDARLYFHAGMIQAKLEDRPAARTLLYRALALNPRFHPVDAVTAAETLRTLSAPSRDS